MQRPAKKKSYTVSLENKKARGSGHERKQEILDAARSLFLTEGVTAVSTRRIAEVVGVSQTSLYVYFANKEAILSAMSDAAFARLRGMLEEVEGRVGGPLEYLEEAVPIYLRFGLAHPDEYRVAFMARSISGGAGGLTTGGTSLEGLRVFASLEAHVIDAMARDLIMLPGASPRGVAQSVWASIHGLVAALLAFPDFDWIETDELVELHSRLVLAGLGFAPAPIKRVTRRRRESAR